MLNEAPAITSEEQAELDEYLDRCYTDREFAFSSMLSIINKEGKEIPFELWEHQRKCVRHKSRINLRLKPRQIGNSKLTQGDMLIEARLYKNHDALTLTKDDQDTELMFNSIRFMDEHLNPAWASDKRKSQAKLIHYGDTNSIIRCQTAGQSEDVSARKGRSSTVHYLHITEAAYIPHLQALLQGAMNSVPADGTIVLESTANGPRGLFYAMCTKIRTEGKEIDRNVWRLGDQTLVFISFLEHPEYRLPVPNDFQLMDEEEIRLMHLAEQWGLEATARESLIWRRRKLDSILNDPNNISGLAPALQFKREFPASLEDAFESSGGNYFRVNVINSLESLLKAKKDAGQLDSLTCGLMRQIGERPKIVPAMEGNTFTLWELPKDGWKDRYLYFGDCAQGLETSDWDWGYILDRVTKRFVARLKGRLGADMHTALGLLLCELYFNAIFAWDITGIGAELRPLLILSNYQNIFCRRPVLPDSEGIIAKHDREDAMGFMFTKSTRSMALSTLKVGIEGSVYFMPDPEFFAQCNQFGYDEDGKGPAAAPGYFDDGVMSAAGAAYCDMLLPPPVQTLPLKPFQTRNVFLERRAQAQARHNQDVPSWPTENW